MFNHHARHAQSDRLPLRGFLLLLLVALCYYGVYWRSGLMLSSEEGIAAVVAQRLNAGQLPIVDTFLGYNVGWFYPVAWLFKVAGSNYLLMRVYFFALAILTGMTAYATVWLVTRRTLPALIAGLGVILMPGAIGRNYMGLLGMFGMLTLLGTFVLPVRLKVHRIFWMAASGVAISLAWLIRIDLGFFQTILFLLSASLFLLKPELGFWRRLGAAILALVVLIAMFCDIQGPVYRDALHRGFGRQFSDQYWVWPAMIGDAARNVATDLSKTEPKHEAQPKEQPAPVAIVPTSLNAPPTPPTPASSIQPPSAPVGTSLTSKQEYDAEESDSSASFNDASLKRPPLASILHAPHFKDRIFALLIYLPVPVSLLLILWGLLLVLDALLSRDPELWKHGAVLLVSTGSSLVLFPQYFFWRPDMIHLAEFMVPFMVTLILGLFLAVPSLLSGGILLQILLLVLIPAAGVDLGVYLVKGWQTDGTGSIAASRRRHLDFTASNGVHVKLNPQELSLDSFLRDTILKHSAPGDFVICFPYYPMVNFMTDRPSYEYNLYADNAISPDLFYEQEVRNITLHHPAVLVIGTGRINNTEASRFSNWASKTYDYIREHFDKVASEGEVEIYAKKQGKDGNQSP